MLHAAIYVGFLHFEIRNAVAQQAADAIVLFKQGHIVACARELLRGRHASRAGANDGDFLAGFVFCNHRLDPAFGPSFVNDGVLNGFDANRVIVDVERACGFARGGADAAGELGEVIGGMQNSDRIFPIALIHEVVEIGNDVVDRAAVVAKRCAAIHAARALLLGIVFTQANHKLFVMLDALRHRLVALFDALKFQETSCFSHDDSLSGWLNTIDLIALDADSMPAKCLNCDEYA